MTAGKRIAPALLMLAILAAITAWPAFGAQTAAGRSMELKSPAFQNGGDIPRKYSCDGADLSPPLKWQNPPAGTQAFAMIVDDPDAPVGTWVHWVIYDIPGSATELPEGTSTAERLPSSARQGINDFRNPGYGGPCPPPGKPHRYYFKLYALDQESGLKSRATKQQLLDAIKGHTLGEAQVVGLFKR